MFIAYFNSFLTPFLLLLESTCHLRRLKNDFKKRKFCRRQTSKVKSLLYVTRFALDASFVTLDFLFTESAVYAQYKCLSLFLTKYGFSPNWIWTRTYCIKYFKKEGYSKSVGSNAGCYFCPLLWVEFLGTLLVVFALFSWHLTNYSWHDRNLWRHFSDCISLLFRLTTPQFPCL